MQYFKYNNQEVNFEPVSIINIHIRYILVIVTLTIFTYLSTYLLLNLKDDYKELGTDFDNLLDSNNELLGIVDLLNESEDFDERNLRLIMGGMNIMYIDVAIAQSKLETNNYTSDIFLESGNLFGMKVAKLRPYTHFGEHRGHADYKGMWKLSVIDYALWQAREAKNVKSIDQYYYLLSKMYAEDPNYINKLKNIVKK